MADPKNEFPVEYLTALDKVIELESFTRKYQVDGAEFAQNRQVKVPVIEIADAIADYDRFKTETKAGVHYDTYTLDQDKQAVFYVDAVNDIDQQHILTTNIISEFERLQLVPAIDSYFFGEVGKKALTKETTNLTAANIKEELRKARIQMVNNGFASADLYMTADALSCLEDAVDRQFSGEGIITDEVGRYNMFTIHMVPDSRMAGIDFAVIAPGVVRHVVKRATQYLFQPGQHTNGDGWLAQMRWVYGNVALKNKVAGMYTNKGAEKPDYSVKPVRQAVVIQQAAAAPEA